MQAANFLQRVLRAYSGKLIARLPKTASGSVNATASAGTTDWQIKMPDDDIPVVCTIVSTAEYCSDIVGSLGRSVAKMLDPPYGDQVSSWSADHALVGAASHDAMSCNEGVVMLFTCVHGFTAFHHTQLAPLGRAGNCSPPQHTTYCSCSCNYILPATMPADPAQTVYMYLYLEV